MENIKTNQEEEDDGNGIQNYIDNIIEDDYDDSYVDGCVKEYDDVTDEMINEEISSRENNFKMTSASSTSQESHEKNFMKNTVANNNFKDNEAMLMDGDSKQSLSDRSLINLQKNKNNITTLKNNSDKSKKFFETTPNEAKSMYGQGCKRETGMASLDIKPMQPVSRTRSYLMSTARTTDPLSNNDRSSTITCTFSNIVLVADNMNHSASNANNTAYHQLLNQQQNLQSNLSNGYFSEDDQKKLSERRWFHEDRGYMSEDGVKMASQTRIICQQLK